VACEDGGNEAHHRSAKNAAAQMKTAELGRRTVPEARGLEILLYWILWRGMPASKTPGDGLDNVLFEERWGAAGGTPPRQRNSE
jgi:hypothetical protein